MSPCSVPRSDWDKMGLFASQFAVSDPQTMAAVFGRCSRPDLAEKIKGNYESWCNGKKLPIAYASDYNIGFLGLERFHPFDSKKFGKVVQNLEGVKLLCPSMVRAAHTLDQESLERSVNPDA